MLCGHKKIEKYFNQLLLKDNLAHAYLFSGPEGVGKTFFAETLIAKLLCRHENAPCGLCASCQLMKSGHHPDLTILAPEILEVGKKTRKKKIGIGQVRDLQKNLSLFPYQSDKKVALIRESEFISADAANALLKTLEEPPQNTILILISSFPKDILPTIVSRCQLISFGFLNNREMDSFTKLLPEFDKLQKSEQELLAILATGRPGFLLKFLRQKDLKEYLVSQANFFVQIFNGQKTKSLLELKSITENSEKLLWAVFVWLSLSRCALNCSGELKKCQASSFLPKTFDRDRLFNISKGLSELYFQIKNPSLNHRLLLENLILQI